MVRFVPVVIVVASLVLMVVALAAAGWWALSAIAGSAGLWFGVTYDPEAP